jgi:hypothetical protein
MQAPHLQQCHESRKVAGPTHAEPRSTVIPCRQQRQQPNHCDSVRLPADTCPTYPRTHPPDTTSSCSSMPLVKP